TENPALMTGDVEVVASEARILNTSKTPPFYINEEVEIEEELALRYRYLYLRRARMRDNIILRHRVVKYMRDFLDARGFLEIETPILMKSTPEGARDYLVPSRIYPGKFYALPQSPQILKQLLMVAGFEKYFQVARCFRDEDLRADRQPEFTQLDIEMSFVEEEDILRLLEDMFTGIVETLVPQKRLLKPFPRLSYAQVMEEYGTDKPDIRFGMKFKDVTDIAATSGFTVFVDVVRGGGKVKGICAPGCGGYTRKQLEELTELARGWGARGLVTMVLDREAPSDPAQLTADKVKSVITKFLSLEQIRAIVSRFEAKPGDLVLIVAGPEKLVNASLGSLRREMARRLGMLDPDLLAFAFIQGFPLFEWNEELGHWEPMHHPFTAPCEEDIPLLDTEPGKVRARHYDFVCNGYEISSGSIRIHNIDLQMKILGMLGYSKEESWQKFRHLLEALEYGAPPHGGVAPGIDRFMMILCNEDTIRNVMAYPKNQNAVDVMMNAPDVVTQSQLDELHLKIVQEKL
ncbi:MAG: aspartate--tRNA ligase, partial [Dehalococcoidia bacterium]|nr:aspartate--tRNA ligase [Dehalococcoidia bacterium]